MSKSHLDFNEMITKPCIINFPKIGSEDLGFISVCEKLNLPFQIKRVYWTYHTNPEVVRGFHAHINLDQILISINGTIDIFIENEHGETYNFLLDRPNQGVYLPKKTWHTMKYSKNAIQLCIANMEYDESDYIRDYDEFKKRK